jgi:hypothetical protein
VGLLRKGDAIMRRYALAAVWLAALVFVAVSCGRHVPPTGVPAAPGCATEPGLCLAAIAHRAIADSHAFTTFMASDGSFTVDVPVGWVRTTSPHGVTFTDNVDHVEIENRTGTAAPTPAWARLTELSAIANATPGVKSGEVSRVTRSAGQAILLTYQQDSVPNPVTGRPTVLAFQRCEFFRNGQTVALTLVSPVGAHGRSLRLRITDSLHWVR